LTCVDEDHVLLEANLARTSMPYEHEKDRSGTENDRKRCFGPTLTCQAGIFA
jgi:hypothetical protein